MTRSSLAFTLLVAATLAGGCSFVDDDVATAEGEVNVAPSPFWKSKLTFPNEPFAKVDGGGQPRWVKFTIFVSEQTKVYFQDSNKYAFHYDFAKSHLPGFASMSSGDFARATLKKEGQKLIVGAVLMPPRLETMELGIQLLREDEYTKEEVKKLHDLVKANITVENGASGASARAFYMPSFEQATAAQRDSEWLKQKDVLIGSPERWLTGDACYAAGWAFGKMKFVAGADIKQAYLDGRLTTEDVLVTDGVPAEVPYVAGIVSLAPSTPSSHVAILSKTWGIPFVYPASQATRDAIRAHATANKEMALRTTGGSDVFGGSYCSVEVIEPKGTIDAATRAALADLRKPPPAEVPARAHLGALTKKTELLEPADVKYFGGKASNFGTLRRTIPNNSPNALGISFDLWEAFVGQTMASGKTLQQEIDERIGALTFPPDMAALEAKLVEIRKLVEDAATIPAAVKTKLFSELTAFGFDPKIKLRFRSSTNVEDGAVLSGAGLYDSYSGCLADDLDTDTTGPSACNANEGKEKGAERAIKKVFASFYNTNAVLERLKYRIPESKVGMALAAHYSYPDENEAANGVATARLTSFSTTVELVSQVGAESVTNPDGSALPETVNVQVYGDGEGDLGVYFTAPSSRVPLGGKVMKWEDDYRALARLIEKASKAFKADHAFTGDELAIDIEYKKDTDGKLVLKQIRQIPERSREPSVVPVLLNDDTKLCVSQGEFGDVLANHRLKAQGSLAMRSTLLSDQAVASSIVAKVDLDLMENGARVRKTGAPASFTGAAHAVDGEGVSDSWKSPAGTMTLHATTRRLVAPADVPLLVARDFRWMLLAKYTAPRPAIDWNGLGETTEESVHLDKCAAAGDIADKLETVEVNGPRGFKMKTEFHYLKPAGPYEKTSSLGKWKQTSLTGLTPQPIVLKGWYSQTFRPGHHNFSEDFMFEPALEEGLPASVKQQLAAKDIQAIVVRDAGRLSGGDDNAKIYVLKKTTGKLEELR